MEPISITYYSISHFINFHHFNLMAVNAKSAKVQVKITFICRINIWQESSTKCNGTIQK